MNKLTGQIGIAAVAIFLIALLTFGAIHPTWSFIDGYVSELGAEGQPLAIWWNLIGFVSVGILLAIFGFLYGKILKDKLTGVLLSLFGLGFALTAIPISELDSDSALSKAHIVAICLGLAFWLFGLARISAVGKHIKQRANITAILLVAAIMGFPFGLWSMALTHRLVFILVFGWTLLSSIELLRLEKFEIT